MQIDENVEKVAAILMSRVNAPEGEIYAASREIVSALSPGSIGDMEGWVLVPSEPTERQLKAAGDAFFDATVAHVAGDLDSVNTPFRRFYRAMLAAAGGREHG